MTERIEPVEQMNRLEQQVRAVSTGFLILVGTLFVFGFLLDLSSQLVIPSLSRMYEEMLPGEPLPFLTMLAIQWRAFSLGLDLVLLAVIAALAASKKIVPLVLVGTVLTLFLLGKALLTAFAMKLPLLKLIEKLGG
ncbi:MAG: hypothetical protein RBU25_16685 [Lentisphaeria bacterium]|jgi:hypothetical protein|nr:hypothetical protein [Lentisphaeria bacterium]